MKIPETVDGYLNADGMPLPIKHPDENFTVTELSVICTSCQRGTEGLRGEFIFAGKSIDIHAAGLCHPCKQVTWSRFRYYRTHVLSFNGSEWMEFQMGQDSLWERLKRWFAL